MKNPFLNRNLTETLKWPFLSWSSLNAFSNYDREKWYSQYVLGERGPSNPAMDAGRVIGERLVTDPTYLPQVPRPEIYEQELKGKLQGINLVGHLDGWSPNGLILDEFKTSSNKNKWTQKTVNEWNQITMYCLLLWLVFKIKPEDIKIRLTAILLSENGGFELIPTGEIKTFYTNRSMTDLLKFGVLIKKTYKEMEDFVNQKI